MPGKHCKLYDEHLVKNIMVSTGRYLLDYLKDNPVVSEQELFDFIERNADNIIQYSLDEMHEENDTYGEFDGDQAPDNDWGEDFGPEEKK